MEGNVGSEMSISRPEATMTDMAQMLIPRCIRRIYLGIDLRDTQASIITNTITIEYMVWARNLYARASLYKSVRQLKIQLCCVSHVMTSAYQVGSECLSRHVGSFHGDEF